MSVIKRTLCTFLSVVVVLIGIGAMTKSRSVDAAGLTEQTTAAQDEESGYVRATLPLYDWDYDENAQPQEVLEDVLREKEPDERMQALIRASFDQLTRNYDAAYAVLRSSGVPDLHTVQMNLVYAVAHTKVFDTFSGQEYTYGSETIQIGNSGGFFWSKYDLMCVREDCLTPTQDTCDLFLHEMMHAYQDVYLDSEYNDRSRGGLWAGMMYILIEGDAQLFNAACSDRIESLAPAEYTFTGEKKEICLVQKGRTCDKRYNIVYKLNTMLQHLLGYDTMQLMRYQPDMKQEETFLSQRYGIDGEQFLHACALLAKCEFTGEEWCEKDGETVPSETPVSQDLLAYVDKVFVQCLAQEIRTVDSSDRQAVEDFFHFYRFYKLQYLPQVRITENETSITITDEFFSTAAVENELYEKCKETGLSDTFKSIRTNDDMTFEPLISVG